MVMNKTAWHLYLIMFKLRFRSSTYPSYIKGLRVIDSEIFGYIIR